MAEKGFDDMRVKGIGRRACTLKGKTRMEVSDRFKSAISFGYSYHSQYDEAKNAGTGGSQDNVPRESASNAEVIDSENIDTTNGAIGCRVKILDLKYDEEEVYQIVGPTEADPFNMRISYESR